MRRPALADSLYMRPSLITAVLLLILFPSAPLPAADEGERVSESQLSAVLEALSLTGTPYVWGGTGVRGLDCSGLVYLIYSPAVPDLPRRSIDQYRFGTAVATGSEEPGDLLFFNTEGWTASHVGIYLGEGRFIHAASGENRQGIIISSLDAPYYRSRYLGARRLDLERASGQKETPRQKEEKPGGQ